MFEFLDSRPVCLYNIVRPPPPGGGVTGGVLMDDETKQIVNRLKSVEGHVRGVERMVAEGAYCIDIVNQIGAIQAALQKVNSMVLDRHLHTCVTTAIRSDDSSERERVISEIMGVFNAKK
jgi:DNA-binding FrmR family transcriptional regulator